MKALLSGPLPRYLRQLLGQRVLAVLLALGGLLQILDLLDSTTEIFARGQGIAGVGHYIALRAPSLLLQALPLAALVGAVFAFSTLAKQHEVIALRAAGLPFRRVVLILLPTVLLVASAQWLLAEVVVPAREARCRAMSSSRSSTVSCSGCRVGPRRRIDRMRASNSENAKGFTR